MSDENSPGGYSQEYVEKIRREAADWRIKYRDLESSTQDNEISTELAKRGIKAEPAWVDRGEGMSASDAVENFAAKYPQTVKTEVPVATHTVPSTDTPGTKVNTNTPENTLKGRSLEEIRKDPVARSEVRARYRQLIQQASRQTNPID